MGKRAKQHMGENSLEEMIGRAQPRPLVGREQEFFRLQQALLETEKSTQARAIASDIPEPRSWVTPSRAPFYLLCGDMGIGKTRLAEEVGREAYQHGWSLLWSRAYAQERAPYQLWIEILRQAMKDKCWNVLEKKISASLARPLATLLPELAHLVHQDHLLTAPHPEQLWEAMLAVLLLISEHNPILIVLDDLQWADNSSCEFLAYLCRHLADLPFLLLGTYRNTSLPQEYALDTQLMQLKRERLVESLPLAPLTDRQIATFVGHMPEQIVQHIQYLAAGNPFFAEELARAVESKKEEYTHAEQAQRWAVPETISALFEQRLERLSSGCKQILWSAAVLGVSFPLSTICLMQIKKGQAPDKESTLALLEEAQQAEILTEQGNGTNITYHFWHPLLLHHLYENISGARRAILHRRAGQILQEIYMQHEEEGAALIVHHLIQGGGDIRQIVHYAEIAGQRAYTLSAYADAERYYRQAIQHLQEHLQKRLHIVSEEQLHIASLQEYLAECLRILNRVEEACQVYEQILTIYYQHYPNITENSMHAQMQAILQFHIARAWYDRGDMERSLQHCEQAEHILDAAKEAGGGAWAYTYLQQSYVYWRKGLHTQAGKLAQQACSLFEAMLQRRSDEEPIHHASPIKRMLMADISGMAHAYYHLAGITTSSGQYGEALVYLNKALKIYEQQNQKRYVAIACNDIGDIYLRLADFSQAQAFFERGLQDARYVGDLRLLAYIEGNSGILAVRCGQLARAEAHFKQTIMLLEQCSELVGKVLFSPHLSLLLSEQGKISEAQHILYSALTIARRLQLVPYIGYVLITVGSMRFVQAMTEHNDEQRGVFDDASTHLLKRARRTLEHAMTFEGIDAEMHLEGCLTLLEVSWLLDRNEIMYEQVALLRAKSEQRGLTWLLPRIERLLGTILAANNSQEQAVLHFEQSLHYARRYDLRREYGRTLYSYGGGLLKHPTDESYARGIQYLQEAHHVFANCQATRDLHKVEQLLKSSTSLVHL